MFFKELFSIFNTDSLMDVAYKRSFEMLILSGNMFKESKSSLREKDTNQLALDIYKQDMEINNFEREVRRDLINHMAVAGTEEFNSALVLATIVIDIERLGDYSKNLVDLAKSHPSKLLGGVFEEDLQKVEAAVLDGFDRVPNQFKNSDVEDAKAFLKEYNWVSKICDQHVNDYINEVDKDLSSGDAVALAMYYRYLKRIHSHLSNVATSIVNPFDQIGFRHSIVKKKHTDG